MISQPSLNQLGYPELDCVPSRELTILYYRTGIASLLEHCARGYLSGSGDELTELVSNFSRNLAGTFHQLQNEETHGAFNILPPDASSANLYERNKSVLCRRQE